MKKFKVTVNGQSYEVEFEEVGMPQAAPAAVLTPTPAPKPAAPAPAAAAPKAAQPAAAPPA